jgi:hypothetical protein
MAFAPEDYVMRMRGWTAEIVRNLDGDGWAIEMTRDGDEAPVYVAPWIMGRNKKDPKPLKEKDFLSWVKSASEFLQRRQRQIRTNHRRSIDVFDQDGEPVRVIFDVEPDDYDPRGTLVALDKLGVELGRAETEPGFQLTLESAEAWVNGGFEAPELPEDESFIAFD